MDLWLWWALPFSFLFIFSIWFSLCFAAVLPPSGSFDRGVNSVFVDLPLNSKAYFHCTSFDYSYPDWKVLHDNIRYSPLDDILIRVLLLIMNLFSLFKLEFMCISLSEKSIRLGAIHLHGFQWLACGAAITHRNYFFHLYQKHIVQRGIIALIKESYPLFIILFILKNFTPLRCTTFLVNFPISAWQEENYNFHMRCFFSFFFALFKNIWTNNITSSICITYYLTLPSLSPDAVRTTTTRALGAPTMPSAKRTHFN